MDIRPTRGTNGNREIATNIPCRPVGDAVAWFVDRRRMPLSVGLLPVDDHRFLGTREGPYLCTTTPAGTSRPTAADSPT